MLWPGGSRAESEADGDAKKGARKAGGELVPQAPASKPGAT